MMSYKWTCEVCGESCMVFQDDAPPWIPIKVKCIDCGTVYEIPAEGTARRL